MEDNNIKKVTGRKGFSKEIIENVKVLYVLENKTPMEINDITQINRYTIISWIRKFGWEKEKRGLKTRVEGGLFDDRLNQMVKRKQRAFTSYDAVQERALTEIQAKDDDGNYTLKFRDAGAAASAMDTAIRGEFALSEETVPLRLMEFLTELFMESLDEILQEEKKFEPDIARKLAERYVNKIKSFGQFWISGGKSAKAMFN